MFKNLSKILKKFKSQCSFIYMPIFKHSPSTSCHKKYNKLKSGSEGCDSNLISIRIIVWDNLLFFKNYIHFITCLCLCIYVCKYMQVTVCTWKSRTTCANQQVGSGDHTLAITFTTKGLLTEPGNSLIISPSFSILYLFTAMNH